MILEKKLGNLNRSIIQINNKMEQMNKEYQIKLQIIADQYSSKIKKSMQDYNRKLKHMKTI